MIEQCVWALGNIAGDSPGMRDVVIRAGAMRGLINIPKKEAPVTLLRNTVWTISNLCRFKPHPPFEKVSICLPVLARLLYHHDDQILIDTLWSVSYLSEGDNHRIQAVIEAGVVRRCVELLLHKNTLVQTPALRALGNMVTGDDAQTQIVLNCGVLPPLCTLLDNPKRVIRKEACWTISNITAGSSEQIQLVINAGIFPKLIHLAGQADFDVKKEASWCLSNATSGGTPEHIKYFVTQDIIPPLLTLLEVPDVRLISLGLDALEKILVVGSGSAVREDGTNPYLEIIDSHDGLTLLEGLQSHEQSDIYEKVIRILRTYACVDEDDDAEPDAGVAQPQIASSIGGLGSGLLGSGLLGSSFGQS
jgi:hypothetical protein